MQNANLKYIKLDKQSGPYVARNIGVQKANGDVIIFIDSDVLVYPKFIEDHISIHKRDKNLVVQGMVRHIKSPKRSNFKFFFPNALCIGTFITQNVSVRKEWLIKVGLFDTSLGGKIGFKDVELGVRLKKLGLKWVYGLRSCKVYHIDGPESKENLKIFFNKNFERGKSAYFFVKKHGKLAEKFAHIRKAIFISNFFQTKSWAEKESTMRYLENTRDSPILPLFPLLRMLVKYHYRAKGIMEMQSAKCKVQNVNLKVKNKKQGVKDNPAYCLLPTAYCLLPTKLKASVIIPTYNRAFLLKYCLRQLLNQTATDYEIIVVDDGSADNTPNLIAKIKIQTAKLKYLRNEIQRGQPYVRNQGIKKAKGEIIISVDSDVMVSPKFVEDHISIHKKNDKLIVQGLVRHIRHPKDIGTFSLKIDGFSSKGLVTQNVSVRKKWLKEVGLMDEKFGITMGYEDTDLGRRLRALGLKVVYGFRKCIAYHVDGYPTREKFESSFEKREQWSKNIVYFGDKYGKHLIKASKVFLISKLFQTSKWAEKESAIKFLVKNVDFPIFFITPLLKEIMKYHYRAKGIMEMQSVKCKVQNVNLKVKNKKQEVKNNSHFLLPTSYFLLLSNCYGEDRSAALIAKELEKLKPKIKVLGAPLISKGEEYEKRDIPLLIKSKVPPSGGFPTRSLTGFLKDAVTSFYIPIRYYRTLQKIRKKVDCAMVVGDVSLLVLGWLGLHRRLFFLAPAKSDYQNPHFRLEEWLMRKICIKVFTHDEYTAKNLRKEKIPASFLGNPMLDELESSPNYQLPITNYQSLIGILPGSREEAYKNFLKILKVVEELVKEKDGLGFAVAIPSTLKIDKLTSMAQKAGWSFALANPKGFGYFLRQGQTHGFAPTIRKRDAKILLLKNAFVDIIKNSDIIIGLAGTANEQAAGLGKPIVSFKGTGPQTSVTRMKNQEKLLGGCLKFIDNFPEGIVNEILRLLDNKELRESMGKAGIERMGHSGGAKRIAKLLIQEINLNINRR